MEEFEKIKHIDENGQEYWEARELMEILEYDEWRNFFEKPITKAIQNLILSNQGVTAHFVKTNKIVETGLSMTKEVPDYKLSRLACYFIALNADPTTKMVALAKSYFAIQTRKQEILDSMTDAERRLYLRKNVKTYNKELTQTAKEAGVVNFAHFHNAGYEGMYNMTVQKLEEKKQIDRGELLDTAGSTELAANAFRITQTNERIKKQKIQGQGHAESAHMTVGRLVRETMKRTSGIPPEDLQPEENIKELEKRIKADQKKLKTSDKPLLLSGSFDENMKKIAKKEPQEEKLF